MVDDMKLTKKQMETVNTFKELEAEHGKGNVFIRWINDYWKACFIIHKRGENTFKPLMNDRYRVNGKVLNALEEKGLMTCCDNNHNEDIDPNSWRIQPEGWAFIGAKIKTELLSC